MSKSPLKSVVVLFSGALIMTSAASLQAAELKVIAGGSMTALHECPCRAVREGVRP